MSKKKEMNKLVNEVMAVRLSELDTDAINRLLQDLQQQEEEILERCTALKHAVFAARKSHQTKLALELRNDFELELRNWKELQLELDDTKNAFQTAYLKETQAYSLGNRQRLVIKDYFVLALIALVLALLGLDLFNVTPTGLVWTFFVVDSVCCLIFLANFFFEMKHSRSAKWYFKNHWIDFVTSIPLPPGDLGLLRGGRTFRLLRIVQFARLLRIFRAVFSFWRGMEQLTQILDVRLMKRSLLLSIMVILIGAFLIFVFEGAPQNPVETIPDSIWWSFTTMVTGGFGDIHNPSSSGGRLLTVLLVIAGMVLIGVFTATLTSILVRDDAEEAERFRKDVLEQLQLMQQQNNSVNEKDQS